MQGGDFRPFDNREDGGPMVARDVMTHFVEGVQATDSVLFAAKRIEQRAIGTVPVFDRGEAVGMLTDRDIVIRVVAQELDTATTTCGEVMTPGVVECNEDSEIEEVVGVMEEQQVRRILVRNAQGEYTGIVSVGDLAMSLPENLVGEVLREIIGVAHPRR
jgi:CBS domain-containing protein